MVRRLAVRGAACLLLILLLANPADLSSCGPFFQEAVFTRAKGPDSGTAFGILQPTYARRYLAIAFRVLSGIQLSDAQWASLANPGRYRGAAPERGLPDWIDARKKVPSALPVQIELYRESPHHEWFVNCGADAFVNARRTLFRYIADFGVASVDTRDWLSAQDKVFVNCGSDSALPDPAKPGSRATIRNDRAYQIAAAYFYSGGYDRARALFEQIAADRSSRWHVLAPYILARVALRQGNWAGAQQLLEAILRDPAESAVHGAAQSLLDYVRGHIDPASQLLVLSKRLLRADSQTLGKDVSDYTFLYDRLLDPYFDFSAGPVPQEKMQAIMTERRQQLRAAADQDELTGWILSFQSPEPADREKFIERWKRSGSMPWLVSALYYSTGKDRQAKALIDAAMRVSNSSDAFPSARFEGVRLMIEASRIEQARSALDETLGNGKASLDTSTTNALRAEHMKIARSFEEFLAYAPRTVHSQDDGQIPSFDADATTVFNERLPESMWLRATEDTALPERLRAQVAQAGWVRSMITGQHETGFARQLAKLKPSYASFLQQFMTENDRTARTFEAAFWMLHHPELQPWVRSGTQRSASDGKIDDFRDNWWAAPDNNSGGCGFNYYQMHAVLSGVLPRLYTNGPPSAAFLTSEEREQAARQQRLLSSAGGASTFLPSIAVAWAKSHPSDSRNAEALALAVKTSHFACTDSASAPRVREAFRLLHERYPKSTWARQTPYWY